MILMNKLAKRDFIYGIILSSLFIILGIYGTTALDLPFENLCYMWLVTSIPIAIGCGFIICALSGGQLNEFEYNEGSFESMNKDYGVKK